MRAFYLRRQRRGPRQTRNLPVQRFVQNQVGDPVSARGCVHLLGQLERGGFFFCCRPFGEQARGLCFEGLADVVMALQILG